MKRKDILKQAKEAIKEALIPLKVNKEKRSLELKIAELEEEVANKEEKIQTEKNSDSLDWDAISNAIDDKDWAKRKLDILTKLKEELY
jgi:hypothetical protein